MKFEDYMEKYAYVGEFKEQEGPKPDIEIEMKPKQQLKKTDCAEIKIEATNVYITITCDKENKK